MAQAAIYVGRGTSNLSVRAAKVMLEEMGVEVALVNAKDLSNQLKKTNCRLLVMPGGRDRPYHASLGVEGAKMIRQFVEQGGSFLGLCAGAYFASARVLFQPGTEMQVDEERPLALFPGTAWGTVTGPEFKYSSEAGTVAVDLGSGLIVYYNGGCAFKLEEGAMSAESEVVARYEEVQDKPPAVIRRHVASGKVILSGVHWEIPADMAKEEGTNLNVVERLRRGESQRKQFSEEMIKYLLQSDRSK